MTNNPVIDDPLDGIANAEVPARVFHPDATVPNWRYQVQGATAVAAELAKWYADPGRFQTLQRTGLPDGELVEFTLTWTQNGVEHTCHQAHILRLQDNRVIKDTAAIGSDDVLDGLRAWYQKDVPPAVTWVNEAFVTGRPW